MVLGTDSYTGQNPGILTRIDPIEDLTRSTSRVTYPVPESTCAQFMDISLIESGNFMKNIFHNKTFVS
jgi:hypothetical protein